MQIQKYTERFDGAPFGVATMAGTLTLPGETNNTVVLDALGHHGTESIAWGEHYYPLPPPTGPMFQWLPSDVSWRERIPGLPLVNLR